MKWLKCSFFHHKSNPKLLKGRHYINHTTRMKIEALIITKKSHTLTYTILKIAGCVITYFSMSSAVQKTFSMHKKGLSECSTRFYHTPPFCIRIPVFCQCSHNYFSHNENTFCIKDLGQKYALFAQCLLSPVTEITEEAFTRAIS